MDASYLRLTLRAPEALEDELAGLLWLRGTLGLESVAEGEGRVRLVAWFEDGDALAGVGEGWHGVEMVARDVVAEEDWLRAFRDRAMPFPVGRSLLVDPREPTRGRPRVPAGRRLLRLPARRAFGIGSHETTRLVVEMLEETQVAGRRVLDVGAGTGILAFTALLRGARSVVALEVDPAAAVQARSNALLNRDRLTAPALGRAAPGRFLLFAGEAGALRPGSSFDLVTVNVLPELILPAFPGLVRHLAAEAELLFSGLLTGQREEVLEHLYPLALEVVEERPKGGWLAFRLKRSGAHGRPEGL